jgi:(p)ppGpp synthase/HD superfamily hydrolase
VASPNEDATVSRTPTGEVLRALAFAARKHRDQRRKGAGAPPFINHTIQVADILANSGSVSDVVTLQAAVLHDTLEDTDTAPSELVREFGEEVTRVVLEVTDDMHLPLLERRRLQVQRAPTLSSRARLVRLGDKIANVRSMAWSPPVGWSVEQRLGYLDWAAEVGAGCRGVDPGLDRAFDECFREVHRVLTGDFVPI